MSSTIARFTAPHAPVTYLRRERVTVTHALANRLRWREGRAHALLYRSPKLNALTAAAILAYHEAQDYRGLSAFLAPIDAALDLTQRDVRPLDAQIVVEQQRADTREDVSESSYLVAPNKATAAKWIRDIDAARAELLKVRQALVARWEL